MTPQKAAAAGSASPSRAYPRLLDRHVAWLLEEFPAVEIVGPRATGKTTTALAFARDVVRLDDAATKMLVEGDADSVLTGRPSPLLLDEWQQVPEVLWAVKRAVDASRNRGLFLLTGSARAVLDSPTWPGTGRVVTVKMFPLTQREIEGSLERPSVLDTLVADDPDMSHGDGRDLRDYLQLVVRGGFPEAVVRDDVRGRTQWLRSYFDHIVERDAPQMEGRRDATRLRRYLKAIVANTAGIVDDKLLHDAASVTRPTGVAYDNLLRALFVVDAIPAWHTNRIQRLVSREKRHLIDSGLACAALDLDVNALLRDGDQLGRLLETFVTAQLRAEREVAVTPPTLFHARERAGRHEVDLIADFGHRGIVGIEVKATSAPRSSDARHLAWLRDHLGDRFLRGVLFHTGPRAFEMGDRIFALPVSTIWA